MEINYYRETNYQGLDEAWDACQFTQKTDLSSFTIKPIVTINNRDILSQHLCTYLTGKETCHAHHFAKLLATKLLSTPSTRSQASQSNYRTSMGSGSVAASPCRVLWIDTLHGPHVCAHIYHELAARAIDKDSFHFVCLDVLGSERDNYYALIRYIEALFKQLKPDLVVIDDIDHFMPFCGVTQATDFCHIVRDVTNHTETAFLFIGYNHLGKKANTAGNLGKYLFINASDVYSLTTQRDVTTVRLVNSYRMGYPVIDDTFKFTIGDDNFPQEAPRNPKTQPIDDDPTVTHDTDSKDNDSTMSPASPDKGDTTTPPVSHEDGEGSDSSTPTAIPEGYDSNTSHVPPKSSEDGDSTTPHSSGSVNNSLTIPLQLSTAP
ncbi:MAG: hypothetical protein IJM58_02820 [Muribaculaceae bacterium]|nr:hypothetical protein [Muribaculaceae bacterium]